MYMPSSVQATYKSKYNDQQIGGLATAAAGLYRGVKAGESFGESLIRQLPLIAEDLKNKGIKFIYFYFHHPQIIPAKKLV